MCDAKECSTDAEVVLTGTVGVAHNGVARILGLQSCRGGQATAHSWPLFSKFSCFSVQYLPAFIELLVLSYTVFAATAIASHNDKRTVMPCHFCHVSNLPAQLLVLLSKFFVAVRPSSAAAHGHC